MAISLKRKHLLAGISTLALGIFSSNSAIASYCAMNCDTPDIQDVTTTETNLYTINVGVTKTIFGIITTNLYGDNDSDYTEKSVAARDVGFGSGTFVLRDVGSGSGTFVLKDNNTTDENNQPSGDVYAQVLKAPATEDTINKLINQMANSLSYKDSNGFVDAAYTKLLKSNAAETDTRNYWGIQIDNGSVDKPSALKNIIYNNQNITTDTPTTEVIKKLLTIMKDSGVTPPDSLIGKQTSYNLEPITGVATGGRASKYSAWGQVFGTVADQDFSRGTAGYQSKTGGFVTGIDDHLNKKTIVGSAVSYASTFVQGNNSKSNVNSYAAYGYISYDQDRINYLGMGSFGINSYNSKRTTSDGTVARADYDNMIYSAKGTVSYRFTTDHKIQIIPFASAQYTLLVQDDYTETGSSTNLHVKTDNNSVLETGLGVTLTRPFQYNGTHYTPRFTVAWYYDPILDALTTTSNFSNTDAVISRGTTPTKSTYSFGTGLDVLAKDNLTVSVDYNLNLKKDFESHTGLLKVKIDF